MIDRERAEDHGYQSGKCPRCHRTIWSDSLTAKAESEVGE